jgi:hypothetical protein
MRSSRLPRFVLLFPQRVTFSPIVKKLAEKSINQCLDVLLTAVGWEYRSARRFDSRWGLCLRDQRGSCIGWRYTCRKYGESTVAEGTDTIGENINHNVSTTDRAKLSFKRWGFLKSLCAEATAVSSAVDVSPNKQSVRVNLSLCPNVSFSLQATMPRSRSAIWVAFLSVILDI